jgi:4-hydroxy-2-oxoheptanedioate aldolase
MINLRAAWNEGVSTYGAWLSIASPVVAETIAGVGFDYVCIDAQHGALDMADTISMVQSVVLGDAVPIVRVPWNEPSVIGRALDAGAHGVIVPMVNTAVEAEAMVQACRYAPRGSRSYGPTAVGTRHGDYVAWADANVAVIPMIETVEALRNLDEILAVPGIDAVYVGPADLSLTVGLPPRNNDGEPAFDDALARIVSACRNAGVVPGAHAVADVAQRRAEQGFRFLTISSDIASLRAGMVSDLSNKR